MEKNNLLTIGDLAKLSGASVKSLRYYSEIGVLPPAFVEPATGYRYYSLAQVHMVDAIQFCIEFGIPLKQFPQYLSRDKKQIHYARLLSIGQTLAEKKIQRIQKQLRLLEQIQEQLRRSQALLEHPEQNQFPLEEKTCLILPCSGAQDSAGYYSVIGELFQLAQSQGLSPRYEFGLLYRWDKKPSRYAFLEVEDASRPLPQLLRLPAATYRILQRDQSGIQQAESLFADLFAQPYPKVVLEVEALLEVSDSTAPLWELRCPLPPKA